MRFAAPIAVLAILSASTIQTRASSMDDKNIDQQTIDALETKVEQAQPREQCFLYAELMHKMTEASLRQYASGDAEKASKLLKKVHKLARKIHLLVTENDKRF